MAGQSTSDKATITLINPTNDQDKETIKFQFNPEQWSITRTAKWASDTASNTVAPPRFQGPEPATVKVEVFLDATDKEDGDITPTVDKLLKAVLPDSGSVQQNQPSAPKARFQWGPIIFKGYIESVGVTYLLFRGIGTPIRGKCDVTIKEFPDEVGTQNPTSGGTPGRRVHRMVAGDTLASVAYREYGKPALWRLLAEANRIDDPMRVPAGTDLLVPPL